MRIAVSACLLGEACRYDGNAKACERVIALAAGHEVLPICPEVAGGLPTPRVPSEIVRSDGPGSPSRVVNAEGVDVTEAFMRGARISVREMVEFDCEAAILKAKSPSCGSGLIYDGSFSGKLTHGWGIAASMIREAGIPVFDENDAERAFEALG